MKHLLTVDTTEKFTSKPNKSKIGIYSNRLKEVVEITSAQELGEMVTAAYNWSCGTFEGSRSNSNWRSSSIMALDFDSGITQEEIIFKLSKYAIHANLIYTTFSDSPELRKFRVVIFLDDVITNIDLMKEFQLKLMHIVNNTADDACKDPCRMWHGGKEVTLINEEDNSLADMALLFNKIELNKNIKYKVNSNTNNSFVNSNEVYNEGNVVELADLDTAIEKVKILQRLVSGEWLGHKELFGIATNLIWIKGGVELFNTSLNNANKNGTAKYTWNNFNAIKSALKYQYSPSRLSSFSEEDSKFLNIISAAISVDKIIDTYEVETQYIDVPAGVLFLGPDKNVPGDKGFMQTLPLGVFNKKTCGCGATHLALVNDEHVILAAPMVDMIQNKTSQLSHVLGIYAGVTKYDDFVDYMDNTEVVKIMVTYDSLPKLNKWLGYYNSKHDFHLIVDEYHIMLKAYSYRETAIQGLLEEAGKFDKVTYLSATPLSPEFTPKELRGLPYTELRWLDQIQIKPKRVKTNKPFVYVSNMITKHLLNGNKTVIDGNTSEELYFFVNSVKTIKNIIDTNNLSNKDVKVVCSDNKSNRDVLESIDISSSLDANKPFSFITSKAFEGSDFYSETGLTVIVSSSSKKHTLADPATTIYQIAGRIRNQDNPFKNTIIHVFSTGLTDLTEEEFELNISKNIDETNVVMNGFNGMSIKEKDAFLVRLNLEMESNYSSYNSKTNSLEYNELKVLCERFDYKIVQSVYVNGLSVRNAYAKAGFDTSVSQVWAKVDESLNTSCKSLRFNDIAKLFVEGINDDLDVSVYSERYPILKKALNTIGTKGIISCSYRENKIKQEIYNSSPEVKSLMLSKLTKLFKDGEFYSSKYIKSQLDILFKEYKIEGKSSKASTLEEYMDIKPTKSRINGKKVSGYITSCKVMKSTCPF